MKYSRNDAPIVDWILKMAWVLAECRSRNLLSSLSGSSVFE